MFFRIKKYWATLIRSFWTTDFYLSLLKLILTGMILSLVGCNWFKTKDKPINSLIEINLKQSECLKKIPDTFGQYFQQQLHSQNELHGTFDCIDQAILLFTTRTFGGSEQNSYKRSELSSFFKTYVIKKELSKELIMEIMKVKVALVGGSIELITKDEFEKIRQLLPFFENKLLDLYPHLEVLFSKKVTHNQSYQFKKTEVNPVAAIRDFKKNSDNANTKTQLNRSSSGQAFKEEYLSSRNRDSEINNSSSSVEKNDDSYSKNKKEIEDAVNELKNTTKSIFIRLNLLTSKYSIDDFYQLINEVEKITNKADHENSPTSLKQDVLAIKKFRVLIVGDSITDNERADETLQIYDTLLDGLKLSLLFKSDIKFREWTSRNDFNPIDLWVNDVSKLIKKSFQLRHSNEIPLEQIDVVLDELYSRGIWIKPLKLETAKEFYRKFIIRFLDNKKTIQGLQYFELNHFKKIEQEYQTYTMVQNALLNLFQIETSIPIEKVRSEIQKIVLDRVINNASSFDNLSFGNSQEIWGQFLTLISTKEIRHWNFEGKVSVSIDPLNQTWSYQELSFLNLIRVPTNLIMSAYGDKQPSMSIFSPLHTSLKVDHIRSVYSEFRDFGSELSLFDLRGEDTASRSTREADLFTPAGNGDSQIQFLELFDLLTVMWSGGELGVSQFKTFAKIESCELNEQKPDYFDKPYLQMECASQNLRKHFKNIFPNLNHFVNFLKPFNSEQWNSFYSDLMIVSRVCPSNSLGLETGDQRTMMVVVHYIENLFSLYDSNTDGLLDENEVEKAYDRFKNFFLEQPEVKDIAFLSKDIFKFVVLKGYKPNGLELTAFMFSSNKGTADRQKLLRVFASLKSNISKFSIACYAN